MSNRWPWALICVEHSKPAIQKERNRRLLGLTGSVTILHWNQILRALGSHEALAPLRLEQITGLTYWNWVASGGSTTAGSGFDPLVLAKAKDLLGGPFKIYSPT